MNIQSLGLGRIVALLVLLIAVVLAVIGQMDVKTAGLIAALAFAILVP